MCKLRCLPHLKFLPQLQYLIPQVKRQRTEILTHLLSSLLLPWAIYFFAACWVKPYDRYKPSFMPPLSLLFAQSLSKISLPEGLWSLFSVFHFPHFSVILLIHWLEKGISVDYSLDSAKGIWQSCLLTCPLPNLNGGTLLWCKLIHALLDHSWQGSFSKWLLPLMNGLSWFSQDIND